jgi:hypothetical protein
MFLGAQREIARFLSFVSGNQMVTARPDGPALPPARRDPADRHIGSSTVSMTWITPFDCRTSAIVTMATSPLASVTVSLPGPACLTISQSRRQSSA